MQKPPVGQISVQPRAQKYFASAVAKISSIALPSHSTEGRFMIVTNAGWDVVDAAASARKGVAGRVSRERAAGEQTNGADADGEVVWS
jgi:hypothetical protein